MMMGSGGACHTASLAVVFLAWGCVAQIQSETEFNDYFDTQGLIFAPPPGSILHMAGFGEVVGIHQRLAAACAVGAGCAVFHHISDSYEWEGSFARDDLLLPPEGATGTEFGSSLGVLWEGASGEGGRRHRRNLRQDGGGPINAVAVGDLGRSTVYVFDIDPETGRPSNAGGPGVIGPPPGLGASQLVDSGYGSVIVLSHFPGDGGQLPEGLVAFVGAPGAYGGEGAVYVWYRDAVTKTFYFYTEVRLPGDAGGDGFGFGSEIVVDRQTNNRVIVGAPRPLPGGQAVPGAAWMYYSFSDPVTLRQRLDDGGAPPGSRFGEAMALMPVNPELSSKVVRDFDMRYMMAVGAPGSNRVLLYVGGEPDGAGTNRLNITDVIQAPGSVAASEAPMIMHFLMSGVLVFKFHGEPETRSFRILAETCFDAYNIVDDDQFNRFTYASILALHADKEGRPAGGEPWLTTDPTIDWFYMAPGPGDKPPGEYSGGMIAGSDSILVPDFSEEVECFVYNSEYHLNNFDRCMTVVLVGQPSLTLPGDDGNETVVSRVEFVTVYEPPPPPPPTPPAPPAPPPMELDLIVKSDDTATIGAAVGSGIAALLLAGGIGYYCWRRKKAEADGFAATIATGALSGSSGSDDKPLNRFASMDSFKTTNSDGTIASMSDVMGQQQSNLSLGKVAWPSSAGGGIYNVPFNELRLVKKLDSGSFKTVFMGSWNANAVAITQVSLEMVNHEVSIMATLSRHPNLVQLFGLSKDTEAGDTYLVMELLPHGSLIRLLHSHPHLLKDEFTRLAIVMQICAGMTALAHEGIVHADLAARNVLVQALEPAIYVKVGDFGLSKTHNLYYGAHDKIPYRWSAPEVMEKGKWTEKSDVWAFGVTIWEIYTGGNIPYGLGRQNKEVEEHVLEGNIVTRPLEDQCPEYMWEVMKSCLAYKEEDRPTFLQLQESLQGHLRRRQEEAGSSLSEYSVVFNAAAESLSSLSSSENDASKVHAMPGTLSFDFTKLKKPDINNYMTSLPEGEEEEEAAARKSPDVQTLALEKHKEEGSPGPSSFSITTL